MKIAEARLKSVSPYSQGKYHVTPKLPNELDDAFEARTWRERCHSNKDGNIMIPPMAFANNIKQAAKFRSDKIQGRGSEKWTKHFESGILVQDPVILPLHKDTVPGEWLFVPSNGQRGGPRRVGRCFPLIDEWEGSVTYYILDDMITEDVFLQTLKTGGQLVGIGRFRPTNLGYYGRFEVKNLTWAEG